MRLFWSLSLGVLGCADSTCPPRACVDRVELVFSESLPPYELTLSNGPEQRVHACPAAEITIRCDATGATIDYLGGGGALNVSISVDSETVFQGSFALQQRPGCVCIEPERFDVQL